MSDLSMEDRDYLRRSRKVSGVPEKVTDPTAIERISSLVLNSETARVMKTVKKSA